MGRAGAGDVSQRSAVSIAVLVASRESPPSRLWARSPRLVTSATLPGSEDQLGFVLVVPPTAQRDVLHRRRPLKSVGMGPPEAT